MFPIFDKDIVDIFKRSIKSGKLHSTYIFTGINGIGKRLFAKYLAKTLFCLEGVQFANCTCRNCRLIDEGTLPDVYEFNKSNLLMENIREVFLPSIALTATYGKYKVIIIDDAYLLSSSHQFVVANALLKTFEEPTENTIFILITDRYDKILPTIRSRAITIRFKPLKDSDIKAIIKDIKPDIEFSDTAVALSSGSVSKAIEILENATPNIIKDIQSKDFKAVVLAIKSLADIKSVSILITNLYPYLLSQYKHSGDTNIYELSQYLLDILQRLNYNVNLELIKIDLTSKIVEVFSETV